MCFLTNKRLVICFLTFKFCRDKRYFGLLYFRWFHLIGWDTRGSIFDKFEEFSKMIGSLYRNKHELLWSTLLTHSLPDGDLDICILVLLGTSDSSTNFSRTLVTLSSIGTSGVKLVKVFVSPIALYETHHITFTHFLSSKCYSKKPYKEITQYICDGHLSFIEK